MAEFQSARVVFDTSTLVSAVLKPQSVPAQSLARAWEVAELVVSTETLDELRQVLARDRLDRFRDIGARREFFDHYEAMTLLCPVETSVVACRDPSDDKFLSLAVSAGAKLIISSDNDLLTLGQLRGVTILRPSQFLALRA